MNDDSKNTKQVKDTDAVLTDKDAAATTLNPNPNFAKPDPTTGEDEGWNSDAVGETLGEDQKTTTGYERRNWQTDDINRQNRQTTSNQNWQTNETSRQTWQSNKGSETMDQAKQTASDVASQVKQAASDTLSQAKQAMSESLGDTKRQMESTFDEQKSQAAGRLGSVANALRQTSEQLNAQNETTFAQYAQSAAEQIENWSELLQTKNLNDLVNEVQDFARRQPELFIAGSLAAGLLLGRFLKSSGSRTPSSNNSNNYNYRSSHDRGNSGRSGSKHSTQDAIARMDYESPAPQNLNVTAEDNYAR
jgi:hypothetical protein